MCQSCVNYVLIHTHAARVRRSYVANESVISQTGGARAREIAAPCSDVVQQLEAELLLEADLWGDMGRYGEMWGDVGRYGSSSLKPTCPQLQP